MTWIGPYGHRLTIDPAAGGTRGSGREEAKPSPKGMNDEGIYVDDRMSGYDVDVFTWWHEEESISYRPVYIN